MDGKGSAALSFTVILFEKGGKKENSGHLPDSQAGFLPNSGQFNTMDKGGTQKRAEAHSSSTRTLCSGNGACAALESVSTGALSSAQEPPV
jgi:hypothetical protein